MGEIHIVLLKTIIKDIEGVVRTLSVGVGANQNVAANPGGGHPHVVEGVSLPLSSISFNYNANISPIPPNV